MLFHCNHLERRELLYAHMHDIKHTANTEARAGAFNLLALSKSVFTIRLVHISIRVEVRGKSARSGDDAVHERSDIHGEWEWE